MASNLTTRGRMLNRSYDLHQAGYRVCGVKGGEYRLRTPEGKVYLLTVDAAEGVSCTCYAHHKDGACKHSAGLANLLHFQWMEARETLGEANPIVAGMRGHKHFVLGIAERREAER